MVFKILSLISFSIISMATSTENWTSCKTSDECVVAPADFCGCGGGGENTAANKSKLKKWNEKLSKDGEGSACLAVVSNHWTCTKKVKADCLKNKCTITESK